MSRALSRKLGCPVIDKDDIKDMLYERTEESGPLAFDVMLNIARRQLLQGLDVICDSPLMFNMTYENAQAIAREAKASIVIIECFCSDEELWEQRINARKHLSLPGHHVIDWEKNLGYRSAIASGSPFPVLHPHLEIDTVRPLEECVAEITEWLEQLAGASKREHCSP